MKISRLKRSFRTIGLITFSLLLWQGLKLWNYATSDNIEKARFDTEAILVRYEQSSDATELKTWLFNGPTEAPGTQVQLTFGRWALTHRKEFAAIVETLTIRQQKRLADDFCNTVSPPLSSELKIAYKNHPSKPIANIVDCLQAK